MTVNNGAANNNIAQRSFTVTVVAPGNNTGGNNNGNLAGFPKFNRQMTNRVVLAGQNVSLSVVATGRAPLKYQWKLNGVNLAGQTGPELTIKNVSTKQTGLYSVSVSNVAGSTNSVPAQLVVQSTPAASLTSAIQTHGQFGFAVSGVTGYKYVVQASSDLVNWVSVETNTAPFNYSDLTASQHNQRYYRAYYLK